MSYQSFSKLVMFYKPDLVLRMPCILYSINLLLFNSITEAVNQLNRSSEIIPDILSATFNLNGCNFI